jgi:hypothetical protein
MRALLCLTLALLTALLPPGGFALCLADGDWGPLDEHCPCDPAPPGGAGEHATPEDHGECSDLALEGWELRTPSDELDTDPSAAAQEGAAARHAVPCWTDLRYLPDGAEPSAGADPPLPSRPPTAQVLSALRQIQLRI